MGVATVRRRRTFRAIFGVFAALLFVCCVLAAALLWRAMQMPSRQLGRHTIPLHPVDSDAAARRLGTAIRFQTVSSPPVPRIEASSEFAAFRAFIEKTYPKVHASLASELVNGHALLFTWRGEDPSLPPALLAAHYDVVPVEPATQSRWTYPPFAGTLADGHVWGRGALDDKASFLGILEAADALLSAGFSPKRTVYLAFGHDEELGGSNGAAAIAELLRSRGVRLTSVLDEGMAVINSFAGLQDPVALIGIAEKGVLSVALVAEVQGGHSSMPPPETAIGVLSRAISRLEQNPLPARLEGVAGETFAFLAPEMKLLPRILFANLWLFRPLAPRLIATTPAANAFLRTTTAPTMLEGGPKENVLPSRATAVVNFRILPGDTTGGVLDHVLRVVNDRRITVHQHGSVRHEPSAVSDPNAPSFRILHEAIADVFGGAKVAPGLVTGATDARHYQPLADTVYRFAPLRLAEADIPRIHGVDERIPVHNYTEVIQFYVQYMRRAAR